MAHSSSPVTRILALQAPLLNLAYTLTGNRNDAYTLLRETTEKAMTAPEAYDSRDALFNAMRSIFGTYYNSRARQRRLSVSSRAYALPPEASVEVDIDAIPEGTSSPARIADAFKSISDDRHRRALILRSTGYSFSEIARSEGISVLRARLRVALASVSFRAIFSL